MEFGTRPIDQCIGCYLAHSYKTDGLRFAKGHLLGAADIEALKQAGTEQLIVAELSPSDVHEDPAAEQLARHAAGPHVMQAQPFTGRANLYAQTSGVMLVDAPQVTAANQIDPAITFACLPAFTEVKAGRMLATAKIIPLAADRETLQAACQAITSAISVAPYRPKSVAVISTQLPHLKDSVVTKTLASLEGRLELSGSTICADLRVPHKEEAVAEALKSQDVAAADLVIVFGASAVVDVGDVIPCAVEQAGGQVQHFGMPVDPGNLLVLAELNGRPVIGAPGCARSPQENGFDWVLQRLLADLPVSAQDIMGLGVGGLLKEIYSRPQPREHIEPEHPTKKHMGVVLAAGRSSRMGEHNKLLAQLHGKPVIRHVVENALASDLDGVLVVTGAMADRIEDALSGLAVQLVHNSAFEEGIATSIVAAVQALPDDADSLTVLLGDMPFVWPEQINTLVAEHAPEKNRMIGVSMSHGRRGNPVLWDKAFFADLLTLHGDIGGKPILMQNDGVLYAVEMGDAARLDLDTRESLEGSGAQLGTFSLKP